MAYNGPSILNSNTSVYVTTTASPTVSLTVSAGSTVVVIYTQSSSSVTGVTWLGGLSSVVDAANSVGRKVSIAVEYAVGAGVYTAEATLSVAKSCHICILEITSSTIDGFGYGVHDTPNTNFSAVGDPYGSPPDNTGLTTSPNSLVIAAIAPAASISSTTPPTDFSIITSSVSTGPIYVVAQLESELGLTNNLISFTNGLSRNGVGAAISLISADIEIINPIIRPFKSILFNSIPFESNIYG